MKLFFLFTIFTIKIYPINSLSLEASMYLSEVIRDAYGSSLNQTRETNSLINKALSYSDKLEFYEQNEEFNNRLKYLRAQIARERQLLKSGCYDPERLRF